MTEKQASKGGSTFPLPSSADWRAVFVSSRPNPRALPKRFLTEEELLFVAWLTKNRKGYRQSLYTAEEVAEKMRELWGALVGSIDTKVLAKHLLSKSKHYAEREYYNEEGKLIGSLRLFSKGLLRKYPMPVVRGKVQYWYGYPREHYRLTTANFTSKYPPHDDFAAWCWEAIGEGVGGTVLSEGSEGMCEVAHWDGEGNCVYDKCYRVELDGKKKYWWIEIHTGSEGYGEEVFIRRFLTAEKQLRNRGRFVTIVPFPRDVVKGREAIRRYNEQKEVKRGEKPHLELRVSMLIHYKQIEGLKNRMGLYKHKKRV